MQCAKCGENAGKFGKTRDGQQRYRCAECKATFSEPKPLAGKSTPIEKTTQVLSMLLEGMSVRATSRLTGVDRDTILRLMVQAGQQCRAFLTESVHQHPFAEIEVDEQWSFVFCKERTAFDKGYGPEVGDAYTFTAIDRASKMIVSFHLGKRDSDNTWMFAEQLHVAVSGRPQISTDGYKPYESAISSTWKCQVDHTMIVKTYGKAEMRDQRRYSPATITGIDRRGVCGYPDKKRATTSHVERHNLSTRMHVRRFTRLTNAHSKKWENHEAMLGLFYCWYNWCRPHMTIKTTPAVAAGLAKEPWTLERLLAESAKVFAAI